MAVAGVFGGRVLTQPAGVVPRRFIQASAGREPPSRALSHDANACLRAHRIEPLHSELLDSASRTLCAVFADSLWADLGPRFVESLLATFVREPSGTCHVLVCGDRVVGFAVGTSDSRQHRCALLSHRGLGLLWPGVVRVLTRPSLVGRIVPYFHPYLRACWSRFIGRSSEHDVEAGEIPPASLILLGVDPEHRRQGVAERLAEAFLAEMAGRGVERVKLAVGASNQPALAFYRQQGWKTQGQYAVPEGGMALRLIYHLDPSTKPM
jgi:ribosomal protein S18 acetylase RimI-like enzyme